jgi:hypothetical protein
LRRLRKDGELAGSAGYLHIVAVGRTVVVVCLQARLSADGAEALLVERELADAASHSDPRRDAFGAVDVHVAGAAGDANRNGARRAREGHRDPAGTAGDLERSELEYAQVGVEAGQAAVELDLPRDRRVERDLRGTPAPVEGVEGARVPNGHGAVLRLDFGRRSVEAGAIEVTHRGICQEGDVGGAARELQATVRYRAERDGIVLCSVHSLLLPRETGAGVTVGLRPDELSQAATFSSQSTW